MKFSSDLPIYLQIINLLKKKIVTSQLKEGDKLDSIRDMSTKLKVNPNTIQRSYQELERENLVYTQRGMGTFVTEDNEILKVLKKEMAESLVNNFVEEALSLKISRQEIIDLVKNRLEGDV